jgi:thioredoxin reductase (NADPH)
MSDQRIRDVAVVGGGLAGLSAAVYLSRAMRDVVVLDSGRSMAVWEPDVQNYLGFPEGISGEALLERGRAQATGFGAELVTDEIVSAEGAIGHFVLRGREAEYRAKRLLLATGIFHIPPDIPEVKACIGHSMFYCKDCDGYRVKGKRLAVVGANDDAVEYALALLVYSPTVVITTNGEEPHWDEQHAAWLAEYDVPVLTGRIEAVEHDGGLIRALAFEGGRRVAVDYLFTTRGDYYHIALGRDLGIALDPEHQMAVDQQCRTSVPGVYAAGCITPANCQMIIAAGHGAIAAQAINRDLFEESLATHALRPMRLHQLEHERVYPEILD